MKQLLAGDLAAAQRAFCGARLPHVAVSLLPDALASLRALAHTATYQPMRLAHHGRFTFSDEPVLAELQDELTSTAQHLSAQKLEWLRHRFSRLRRGDYALYKDDEDWLDPSSERSRFDFTFDLSELVTGEAEVLYTHRGDVFCMLEQRPGNGCLVKREPTVRRYERYLSHRVDRAEVLRLRVSFGS